MFCFNLFHFDIPWNPARLEQRNGRIDRKLQPSPIVYCRYFLYENREEDTILRRIVEKTEKIYRELGGFGTVLDKGLIQTLRRRGIERARLTETIQMFDFRDDEEDSAAALAMAEVSGEDETDEDAVEQSPAREEPTANGSTAGGGRGSQERRTLRKIMEESRRWLDFRETQFRAALDCSLRLMDIEGGLTPEPIERPRARRYFFPTTRWSGTPRGARPSIACAAPAAAARISAPGMLVPDPADRLRGPGRSPSSAAETADRPGIPDRTGPHAPGAPDQPAAPWPVPVARASSTTTSREPAWPRRRARCRWSTCSAGSASTGSTRHDCTRMSSPSAPSGLGRRLVRAASSPSTRSASRGGVHAAARRRPAGGGYQPDQRYQASGIAGHGRSGRPRASGPSRGEGEGPRGHDPQGSGSAGETEAENTRSCWKARRSGSTKSSNVANVKRPPPGRRPGTPGQGRADPLRHRGGHPSRQDERSVANAPTRDGPWRNARRTSIREILEEPDRIRGRFAVQTVRLEPVGIVYLWPEMG